MAYFSLQEPFAMILEKTPKKRANWEKIKIQLGKIFFPIGNLKLGISSVNMPPKKKEAI